ncbi:universal stress protein [Beggiatoa sp. PS]|nr:universal stress protein [Beggiatoa sp. PS]
MTQLYRLSKLFVVASLFLCLQVGSSLVQAGELVFEPANPTVETLDEITLTVSGTVGDVIWKTSKGEIRGSGPSVTYIASGKPEAEMITVTDATGNKGVLKFEVGGFMVLNLDNILFLLIVGFIGGLVSGFIGSGGAFVLTPAMMSMGVPAVMAVASNMCHKFPKALVGSMKRAKYGQVDVKLGIVMGISAEAGVLYGASIQTHIKEIFGDVGSNLYVSFVFVVVLAVVGGYVLRDAYKIYKDGSAEGQEHKITKLAKWVQSVHIPGTMMYFPSIGTSISVLFTIPLGFATGMLAATIAVGGFVGVPAMMYVLGVPGLMASATELVVAFVMGMGGTIKFALDGLVDIRLAMIILAGSLFGVQLGAIGTTYVKDFMIKVVMGVIMILVLFSRGLKVPVYLSDMGKIDPLSETTITILDSASFVILILALLTGAVIILYALIKGYMKHSQELVAATEPAVSSVAETESFPTSLTQLSPMGRFENILAVTDSSELSIGATNEAIRLAQRTGGSLSMMSVVKSSLEHESFAKQLIEKENSDAIAYLETVKRQANDAGVDSKIGVRHGIDIYSELVDEAEKTHTDIIVMGRRGLTGLKRIMMGSNTAKVIGYAHCNVLVVPRAAKIEGKNILLAIDGSRHGDIAASTAVAVAKHFKAPVSIVSVVYSDHKEQRYAEAVEMVKRVEAFMSKEGITIKEGQVLRGRPADTIVEVAKEKAADLIIMGSHGRTGIERVLMGSVSDRVIGYADCAVLVVKT